MLAGDWNKCTIVHMAATFLSEKSAGRGEAYLSRSDLHTVPQNSKACMKGDNPQSFGAPRRPFPVFLRQLSADSDSLLAQIYLGKFPKKTARQATVCTQQ